MRFDRHPELIRCRYCNKLQPNPAEKGSMICPEPKNREVEAKHDEHARALKCGRFGLWDGLFEQK